MIALSAEQAGRALGVGTLEGQVAGVSIDTRTLRRGDLFIAMVGERFDGHDYVPAAFAAGASGAVVEERVWRQRSADGTEGTEEPGGVGLGPVYEVADTVAALGALAREVRRASGATVFAVTGSAGKTSTKDILRAMVETVRETIATAANQNNEVGVPLTLLEARPDTAAIIVEMGMRGLGQISALAAVAEPDVGIITNVHPVHLELLGSLENVARAKAELVAGIRPGGAAVVPAQSEPLEALLDGCSCRLVRFGIGEGDGADVTGWLEPGTSDREYTWVVRWPGGETRVGVGPMPRHTLENAVAAIAACYAAGLPVDECAAGIRNVELNAGRGQIVEVGGVCVIDDTYNANPAAVSAALDHLVQVAAARGGRAVAVLGDMLELGSETERYHEQAGESAAAAGVSVLWGVGPLSVATVSGFERWCREHAADGGEWTARQVDSCDEAESVVEALRPGDVILVKGSRGVRLEKVVIRMVGEARAGRWGGGSDSLDVDDDLTGEKRHC